MNTINLDPPELEPSAVQPAAAETILNRKSMRAKIGEDATIRELDVLRGGQWQAVGFRHDEYAGPKWIVENEGNIRTIRLEQKAGQVYQGAQDGVEFGLTYGLSDNRLTITATIHNGRRAPFAPERAGVMLGLDTAQVKFPEWRDVFFPTLIRCEPTHFWGYLMNPAGRILAIGSPDPVASWHHCYNDGGHLIFATVLDLMNSGPLPDRHPRSSSEVAPGKTRSWTIHLQDVASLAEVKPVLSKLIRAPMIEADRYTVEAGRSIRLKIHAPPGSILEAVGRGGTTSRVELNPTGKGVFDTTYTPVGLPGVYTLRCSAANGRTGEAKVSVRHPWSWYLKRARAEAINKPQKASSHVESWLGFYSGFLARIHFPDAGRDALIETRFQEVYPLMYPLTPAETAIGTGMAKHDRIQNQTEMAGLLAAKYRASGDLKDLELAASLIDFVLSTQTSDGAYREGNIHYTCVTYCAKSILEVIAEERKVAVDKPEWKERCERHFESVKRAIDDLALKLDNIQTEGEMTYEDGMISCSYTQLALFALLQGDSAIRRKYLDAALFMKDGHRCLSQVLIPDSRMNGASLRFWEAQYDVLMKPNMISSPHGWSAWRIYGLWYLYLLTGEEGYLRQVQNALGACVQLIDADSGELRWAFVPDPFIRARMFVPDPARQQEGLPVKRIIGECYIPMISGWYHAPANKITGGYWDPGGCCDNDVHEIFKCLEEVALTSSYLIERSDGTMATWNCNLQTGPEALEIIPVESCVSRIHLNLRAPCIVQARFADGGVVRQPAQGSVWIGPGAKDFIFAQP